MKFLHRLSPLEQFVNSGWSTACSPDDIIVASLLQSFAKEPELWTKRIVYHGQSPRLPYFSLAPRNWVKVTDEWGSIIRRGEKPIEVRIYLERASKDRDGIGPYWYRNGSEVQVGDLTLAPAASSRFLFQIQRLIDQRKAVDDAAKKALLAMEQNEKKWEIAEQLLNMKRNEFGALVPITPAIGTGET